MIWDRKVLVVDVDGTLCPIKEPDQSYADLPAFAAMRERLIELRSDGWRIVLSSSRGMRTHNGCEAAIEREVLPTLLGWLERNGVPFDQIRLAKPWAGTDGFYVDDRTVRPREFLTHSLEALSAICQRDRLR